MKKISKNHFVDMILVVVAVYLLFTIKDWSNIDAFYQLLVMLYIICVLLRIVNTMKRKRKEILLRQKQEQQEKTEEN